MFKIGVGPSSSHTMGPWRATQRFLDVLRQHGVLSEAGPRIVRMTCDLFGSLSKTGHGHGTDVAVILALAGDDPVTCDTSTLDARVAKIRADKALMLAGMRSHAGFAFNPATDIRFRDTTLPFHPNGMTLTAELADGRTIAETYYSIGGGFVVQEQNASGASSAVPTRAEPPYPVTCGDDLLAHCRRTGLSIPQIVMANERAWRSEAQIRAGLLEIWDVMADCIWRGCHTFGTLPGGLNVRRRAAEMSNRLLGIAADHTGEDQHAWRDAVRSAGREFTKINKWVACFALAVNEENACFGRVVTAPTNGAAGVIPAVMMYFDRFCSGPSFRPVPSQAGSGAGAGAMVDSRLADAEQGILDFMLTAGQVGAIFKRNATISAAMGGCQAEIGVSSAMAAAGLAQVTLGELATPARVLMAAEIAMEHHLGMTCDPIAGLVQIPCIERNTMGAIKAITAVSIASESDPATAKVSFDDVVRTMWQTSLDMQSKYKETAEGGLAVHVTVGLSEC
jgi:L-serine dehydratase